MAWAYNLLDASFRGVTFDCRSTDDDAERAVASHEYPYQDGEDQEDLGRQARRFSLQAVFFGEDYDSRLQAFLQVLDQPGHGELIHPVFGSIKQAQLRSYRIHHEADSPDYCSVDLAFTEATPGNPFFVQQLPAQQSQAIEQQADLARFAGVEAFATALAALKSAQSSLGSLNALRGVMTGTLAAVRSQLRGMIGTVLDLIDYPRAFAADLSGLLHGMVDLRGFDTDTIMADWHAVQHQLDDVVRLPARTAEVQVSTVDAANLPPGITTAVAVPAKAEQVALITAMVQLEAAVTLAEVASMILAMEADQPTLSPPEVEQLANAVRSQLQAAIDNQRATLPLEASRPVTEALKQTAHSVQQAAIVVIDLHPPLIQRQLDAPGNLHLVAHRWYGNYRRAQELARLNPQLINPNTLQAGDTLYAYAR